MKKFRHITSLLIVLFITIASCSDKKDTPEPQSNSNDPNEYPGYTGPTGPLKLHLHHYIDINEVDEYKITYRDANNRSISLNLAQFYLSDFELVKLDGSILKLKDTTVVLKVREEESFFVRNVPIGNYKSINFSVGLNNKLSSKVSTQSATDVLNRSEMWFGSTAQDKGYVFLNISGKIDTISDPESNTGVMQPFEYKIGTKDNLVKVTMPQQNYTVVEAGGLIHMYADISKLFNGIKLNDKNNLFVETPDENSSALAKKIVSNISSMFKYEN